MIRIANVVASGGWLSGWEGTSYDPGRWVGPAGTATIHGDAWALGYIEQGRLPTAAHGVVNGSVCFSRGTEFFVKKACAVSATVGVLRCDGYLLFRLPYIEQLPLSWHNKNVCEGARTDGGYVDQAYCTAHVNLDDV